MPIEDKIRDTISRHAYQNMLLGATLALDYSGDNDVAEMAARCHSAEDVVRAIDAMRSAQPFDRVAAALRLLEARENGS